LSFLAKRLLAAIIIIQLKGITKLFTKSMIKKLVLGIVVGSLSGRDLISETEGLRNRES